jgi:hypothetical protein
MDAPKITLVHLGANSQLRDVRQAHNWTRDEHADRLASLQVSPQDGSCDQRFVKGLGSVSYAVFVVIDGDVHATAQDFVDLPAMLKPVADLPVGCHKAPPWEWLFRIRWMFADRLERAAQIDEFRPIQVQRFHGRSTRSGAPDDEQQVFAPHKVL